MNLCCSNLNALLFIFYNKRKKRNVNTNEFGSFFGIKRLNLNGKVIHLLGYMYTFKHAPHIVEKVDEIISKYIFFVNCHAYDDLLD